MTSSPASGPGAGPDGCAGVCFPGPPGLGFDRLAAEQRAELAEAALALLESTDASELPAAQPYLDTLRALLLEMPGPARVAAFRPALCRAVLAPAAVSADPLGTALALSRFLVGAPDLADFCLVIPEEAFPDGRLYFPHLHAVLEHGGGPVAVWTDDRRVRFTWVDGRSASLPLGGLPGRSGDAPHLRALHWVRGFKLLNGIDDVTPGRLGREVPSKPAPEPRDLAVLDAAVELLGEVWPEARSWVERSYEAVLVQPLPQDHVTSLTLESLPGAFIASLRDPIQVADVLCHEGSHLRMARVLHAHPLLEDDGAEIHPSPWRPDLRPMRGILYGVHAFANVCEFYRRLGERAPEHRERAERVYAVQREKIGAAWQTLESRAQPTPLGEALLAELRPAVEAL